MISFIAFSLSLKFGRLESAYRVKIQSENRFTNYGYVTFCSEEPVRAILGGERAKGKGVSLQIYKGKTIKVQGFVKGGRRNTNNKGGKGGKTPKRKGGKGRKPMTPSDQYHSGSSGLQNCQKRKQVKTAKRESQAVREYCINRSPQIKFKKAEENQENAMRIQEKRVFDNNQHLIKANLKPTIALYHQLVDVELNSYPENLRFNKTTH